MAFLHYEQGRAGQGGAGQGRAGQGRAGQGRAGQGRAGHGRAGQGRGKARAGQPQEYSRSASVTTIVCRQHFIARPKQVDTHPAIGETGHCILLVDCCYCDDCCIPGRAQQTCICTRATQMPSRQ